jgi:hypothetical protein
MITRRRVLAGTSGFAALATTSRVCAATSFIHEREKSQRSLDEKEHLMFPTSAEIARWYIRQRA